MEYLCIELMYEEEGADRTSMVVSIGVLTGSLNKRSAESRYIGSAVTDAVLISCYSDLLLIKSFDIV